MDLVKGVTDALPLPTNEEPDGLKELNDEDKKKDRIRRKRDFLDANKPKFEDLSSHSLYFEKKNLGILLQNDFG